MFSPWIIIDLVIIYTTVRFGPEQWKHSPLVANNLAVILGVGTVLSFVMHWALVESFPSSDEAAFWSGFGSQLLLGVASVAQLMSRDNTSGHSWSIW
jgi:paspaline synthase